MSLATNTNTHTHAKGGGHRMSDDPGAVSLSTCSKLAIPSEAASNTESQVLARIHLKLPGQCVTMCNDNVHDLGSFRRDP